MRVHWLSAARLSRLAGELFLEEPRAGAFSRDGQSPAKHYLFDREVPGRNRYGTGSGGFRLRRARRYAARDTLPFVLILLVASVPVALPATFTLATALGTVELARRGVLVTRLSAIDEAAAMDMLCSDKTGTITQNQLSLSLHGESRE
jgi:hypothetical protein